jgi:hypothetical protein
MCLCGKIHEVLGLQMLDSLYINAAFGKAA